MPKSQSYFCPFLWLMEMHGQAQTEPVGRNRPGAPGRRGGALEASGRLPYCSVPTADLAPCLQHSLAQTLNEDANKSACLRVCCKGETINAFQHSTAPGNRKHSTNISIVIIMSWFKGEHSAGAHSHRGH